MSSEAPSAIQPSPGEVTAIRNFCAAAVEKRDAEEAQRAAASAAAADRVAARAALFDRLVAGGVSACHVTLDHESASRRLYLRRKTYYNTLPLTEDVVRAACASAADEAEADAPAERLAALLVAAIQKGRKTSKEFVSVTATKPPHYGGTEAHALAPAVRAYADADARARAASKRKREESAGAVARLAQWKGSVDAYLTRTGLKSQRVNLRDAAGAARTFYLRKKATTRTPRVTAGDVADFVGAALRALEASTSADVARLSADIAAFVMARVKDEARVVRGTTVTLDAGRRRAPRDE